MSPVLIPPRVAPLFDDPFARVHPALAHPALASHTKALRPVIARPTISVFISRVPS